MPIFVNKRKICSFQTFYCFLSISKVNFSFFNFLDNMLISVLEKNNNNKFLFRKFENLKIRKLFYEHSNCHPSRHNEHNKLNKKQNSKQTRFKYLHMHISTYICHILRVSAINKNILRPNEKLKYNFGYNYVLILARILKSQCTLIYNFYQL